MTTYYVATNGSDSNNGTSLATPFLTPAKAKDTAHTAGDIVYFRGGTYNSELRITYGGAAGNHIVYQNYQSETPIIQQGIHLRPLTTPGAIAHITLSGLTVTGSNQGIDMVNGNDIYLYHNNIHHQTGQGISGNGYQILIDGNIIEHCGPFGVPGQENLWHGMYFGGTEVTLINNIFKDNLAFGIQLDGAVFNPSFHPSVEYATAKYWLIANNVIADHDNAYGVVVWKAGATDNVIKNNIFYLNGGGVQFQNSGGNNLVSYNLFYNLTASDIADTAGGASYTVDHSISGQNPNFVNPSTDDYRVVAGSPAIDAGTLVTQAALDRDGIARPRGTAYDLGAYEYLLSLETVVHFGKRGWYFGEF